MVSIECKVTTRTTDFFGRTYEQESASAGSGIIISQQGNTLFIATNEHVINSAKSIQVYFTDGTSTSATVKGSDVNADLAVVCVDLRTMSQSTRNYIRIATIGDSDQLKAGDFVVAVGNALGTGQSVTVGYVSALEREVTIDDITRTLLQTDAAINPGNSGGALLNQNGEVIGINSAKYASESVEGTGFAIPMADAVPILTELMNREAISEKDAGFLGIQGKTVTSSYSQRFGIPLGVYVGGVKSGSPADKAGIREGDVVVAYNGAKISTNEDLQTHLDSTRAGTTVVLTISRLEKNEYVETEVEVTLEKR
jgi:serine protease Do